MKWLHKLKEGILIWNRSIQSPFLSSHLNLKHYSCYLGKWELPQGYETGISVYNSAANQKVPLVLKNKDIATWYVCGPTVYDESHIGHASCYVKFDIIRRIMEDIFGIKVFYLMGITDIDDKIIKKSTETGLRVSEVSKKYELDFFNDMCAMQVKFPSAVSRVTDNIPSIISFCEKLIEKEYAYVTDEGSVYFMVSKGVSSDVLCDLPQESQLIIDTQKRDTRDFALWKAAKENEPYWISPWGKGRPGWHIECSAMASKMFGSHLDLHSGGYDLLFPHHSNEKSQSEAYHNCKQWGNYWLHSGLLQLHDEVKMSKSIKNTVSVKQFLKEHSANDFRILCLLSPFRKNMTYSDEAIASAKGLHYKFHNFINESESYITREIEIAYNGGEKLLSRLKSTKEEIIASFSDDFNTHQALYSLSDLIDEINEGVQVPSISDSGIDGLIAIATCADYIDKMLNTLGVTILSKKTLQREFVHFMDAVNQFRTQIRLFSMCEINSETWLTASEFLDNTYKLFCTRKSIIDMKNLHQITSCIDEDVSVMFKKASEFALSMPPINASPLHEQKKIERKKRVQLLFLCDELRSTLQERGITVKDRKNITIWFPSPTFSLR